MGRKKVSVIGGGFTGATTAFLLAQQELCDVVLLDIPQVEDPTKGKALDMSQAGPVLGFDAKIVGTCDYHDTANSDLVIITAGVARKPGMSRDDLVSINAKVVSSVTEQIMRYSPECIIIVLTNPVDAMTYEAFRTSGLPKERVLGQSGVLDTARFRTFVAEELDVSVEDVTAFVLGGHGDDMVPLVRYSYAGGIPLDRLLPMDRISELVQRTRTGGGEIVNLLGNGSAYYAPAASLVQMAEAILKDKRRILPAVVYLDGEYGYNDLYLGVPVILGSRGVERILELELTVEEREALDRSANSVRDVLKVL